MLSLLFFSFLLLLDPRFGIRNGKKSGPGINIPDPQHGLRDKDDLQNQIPRDQDHLQVIHSVTKNTKQKSIFS
jgi:hypothetical protein